jgi:DNA polymerase III epsilon subunit-like protein
MTKLVFLDTETTGLDPRRHELLEVGMIIRTDNQIGSDKTVHFSLNIDPTRADTKALEVNRYWDRVDELANIQVSESFAENALMLWLQGAVIIGNNPQFDLRFIEAFLRETPWHYHPVDLKALVAGRLGLGEPPWSTSDIAEQAQVPIPENAHSALVDARWNRDLYDAVMNYRPTTLPNGSVNPQPHDVEAALQRRMETGGLA